MRRGYHRVIINGETIEGPVVVITGDDGAFVSFEPLENEQPFTAWIGGTFVVDEAP